MNWEKSKVSESQVKKLMCCDMKNNDVGEEMVELLTNQFQNLASPSKFGSDSAKKSRNSHRNMDVRILENPEMKSRRTLKRPGKSFDSMHGKPPKITKTYELRSRTNLVKKRNESSNVDEIVSKKRKVVREEETKFERTKLVRRRKNVRVKSAPLDSSDSKTNSSGVFKLKSINDIPNQYLPFLESSDDEENAEGRPKFGEIVSGLKKSESRDRVAGTVQSYSRLKPDSPSPPPSPDRFKIRKFMRPGRQSLSSRSQKTFKYNMPWLHRRPKPSDEG